MLLSALVIGSSHLHQKNNALYNVLTVRNLGHSPHCSEDQRLGDGQHVPMASVKGGTAEGS
jgi:hypothetical protein